MAVHTVTQDDSTIELGDNDDVIVDIPGGGTVTLTADPNETVDKIRIDFTDDSEADTVRVDLSTFSEDGLRIDLRDYDPTDRLDLMGAFDMTVNPDDPDELHFSYVGADGNTYTGYARLMDGGEKNFLSSPSPVIICFAAGTVIETALGPRPVESILPGDLVCTRDNGDQPVRWVGRREVTSLELLRFPDLSPIRVAQGALGGGLPWTDLMLSPQHRLLLSDWRMELMFGASDVLVAVKHLEGFEGIAQDFSMRSVTYYHLLFDRHEIVTANGLPCESLHPGEMAMMGTDAAMIADLQADYPELTATLSRRKTSHMVLKRYEIAAALSGGPALAAA